MGILHFFQFSILFNRNSILFFDNFFNFPLLLLSLLFNRDNNFLFLVACYATLHPALSVRPSVGPSVRHTTFLALMGFLTLLLLPKCSVDLNYGPCPPARDWGSRVSGLVFCQFPMLFNGDLIFHHFLSISYVIQ